MKRFAKQLLVAAVLMIAMPATALGAGFATTTQSGTSTGMGGVGVANPHEPNASYFNPALMSVYDGFNIYGGLSLIMPSTSYESFDGDIEAETDDAIFPPPNAHAQYNFGNLYIGVGAFFPFGLAIEWPDEWVGRESVQFQQLRTLDLTPSVAYEIPGVDLTVAGGLQVVFSSIELHRRIILREDTEIQSELGGTGQGVGATAGLLFQPTDNWTFGANYRSAVNIDYEGDAHFEGEEGTPFEQQFVDGDVTTELTLPHYVSVGAGWQMDRLFLELDLIYTSWQTYDEVVIDFERDRPQDTSTIENDWNGAGAIRFGAQYEVLNGLPVRLGIAFDQTPIPDETVSASLPGNHRLVGSVGLGYTFDFKLRVDAAYQVVAALEREIRNDTSPRGEYQTTAHIVGLNVGYGYEK